MMNEKRLRDALLVKVIEESDPAGEIIALADRATASREALRQGGSNTPSEANSPAFDRTAQQLLTMRTDRLLEPLLVRYPFLRSMLSLLDGPPWIGAALLVGALVLGGSMSAVDGGNRIDVLGFPLLFLVLWNFIVYAWLIAAAIRGSSSRRRGGPLAGVYLGWVTGATTRLLAQAARFHAPLTAALQRFMAEWLLIARPALLARGIRLIHLASVCVASGLIAALYFRGIGRGYRAGWDSTWPDLVPPLLRGFYGPASWLTHIALPAPDRLAAIRWSAGSGEPAAPWIHLMAVTALVFIIAPRLVLAAGCSLRIWRMKQTAPTPASIVSYHRRVLGPAGLLPGRGILSVVPYGYDPRPEAMLALRQVLMAVVGDAVAIDTRAVVPFGQEESLLSGSPAHRDSIADGLILLMSLASTPENEHHGAVIDALREGLAKSQSAAPVLVAIDEGPYADRMKSAPERLSDRRAFWLQFLRQRAIPGVLLDLRPASGVEATDQAAIERLRAALQSSPAPAL